MKSTCISVKLELTIIIKYNPFGYSISSNLIGLVVTGYQLIFYWLTIYGKCRKRKLFLSQQLLQTQFIFSKYLLVKNNLLLYLIKQLFYLTWMIIRDSHSTFILYLSANIQCGLVEWLLNIQYLDTYTCIITKNSNLFCMYVPEVTLNL